MMISIERQNGLKSSNSLLFGLVILVLLSSCSNAEVENQLREDLSVVESERDDAIAQQNKLKQDLTSLETEHNTLSLDLDSAVNKGNTLQEELNSTQKELDSTTVDLDHLHDRLSSTKKERDGLQEDLDSTETSLDSLKLDLDSISLERDELLTFNEELKGRVSILHDELRKRQVIFSETQIALSAAENRVQELLLKYDEEIRADLLTEANAEIERACSKAIERYNDSIESSIDWNIFWNPVITKIELLAAVEKCAEPGRSNAADVDMEIERACEVAIEQYNSPVAQIVQWKSSWSTVISQDELIEAVAICAEPQRSIFISLKSEVDLAIERTCGIAIERYSSSVESNIQWNNDWSQIISEEDFVNKVAKCAEDGRANAVDAWAEIDRACDVAIERYKTPVSSLINWRSTWSSVMSRDELIEAVEECAEPARSQAAERALSVPLFEEAPAVRDGKFEFSNFRIEFQDAINESARTDNWPTYIGEANGIWMVLSFNILNVGTVQKDWRGTVSFSWNSANYRPEYYSPSGKSINPGVLVEEASVLFDVPPSLGKGEQILTVTWKDAGLSWGTESTLRIPTAVTCDLETDKNNVYKVQAEIGIIADGNWGPNTQATWESQCGIISGNTTG